MAAERAPTIATTIQPIAGPGGGRVHVRLPDRQKGAGQGERQGEDGMLELDHFQREPEAFPHILGARP